MCQASRSRKVPLPPDTHVNAADSASVVAALASRAVVSASPCGSGDMVWRRWGDIRDPRHVVLCHGGAGSWTHWIKTLPALMGRGCIWAPDLPGLGDSAMPDPQTPEGCGAAVAAGILAQVPPHARLQLVGFSWGSHVATVTAALLGSRVEALTIVGCAALGLPQPELNFARESQSMSDAERDDVHRANLRLLMIANVDRIDRLALDLQADNVRRARFNSRRYAETDLLLKTIQEVTADVSTIWGDRDQIALPTVEARIDAVRRAHPSLRSSVIADAGHWVMYEQAEAFNRTLIKHLSFDEISRTESSAIDA
jgi:2-hydroxy-6-oxonona-2,4-dienedioate hydrolase